MVRNIEISFQEINSLLIREYGLDLVNSVEYIQTGLIHKTFRIRSDKGDFAFQQLHPKLSSDAILSDYKAVTNCLVKSDFPAPSLILTRTEAPCAMDDQGNRWRLSSWLSGKNYESLSSSIMAYRASRLLGRFHDILLNLNYTFQSTHPLHDTKYHLQRLKKWSRKKRKADDFKQIRPMIDFILKTLPELELPELRQWVVHGDLKISNFLFDRHGSAVGLIDLDTCTRHSVLVDLGDAIRSWCRSGGEDEEQHFMIERYEALLQGYADSQVRLSKKEIYLLPRSGQLITLELATRFLTDVLEDTYFGWDPEKYPSRKEHNIARAKAMIFLARDMKKQEETMSRIVKRFFG